MSAPSIPHGTVDHQAIISMNSDSVVRTHYEDDIDDDDDNIAPYNTTSRGNGGGGGTNGERTPLIGTPTRTSTRLLQDSRDHSLHTLHLPDSSTGSGTGVTLPITTITTATTTDGEGSPAGGWREWMIWNGVHPQTWTGQTYLKAGLLATLLTFVILAFTVFRVQDHIKEILLYIDDHRSTGAVLFVTFYTIACWLFLPGSLFTIGAGFLFRPMPFALAIVLAGDILGALGSFLFGRYIFYNWVKGMMSKHPKFGALDQVIQDDGWKIVVMLRLTPIPFNLITYFFSITSIKLTTLLWATALGVFPGSCLGIWIGSLLKGLSGIDNPELETRHVVILIMNGVFIVCSILTLSIFGKRSMRKAMAQLDRHQQVDAAAAATLEQHQRQIEALEAAASMRSASSSASSTGTDTVISPSPNLQTVKKFVTNNNAAVGTVGGRGTEEDERGPHSSPHADIDDGDTEAGSTPPRLTESSTGFTRGEIWTFVGIAIVAVINVCVCVPLYYHFKNQPE